METGFNLDNFHLTINKSNSAIVIQGINKLTGDVYSKSINKDSIPQYVKDPVFDLDGIFKVFQDYQEGGEEKAYLSIDDKAEITHIFTLKLPTHSKQSGFSIRLEHHQLSTEEKGEKINTMIFEKLERLEKENKALHDVQNLLKEELEKCRDTIKENQDHLRVLEKVTLEKLLNLEIALEKANEKVAQLEAKAK